MFWKFKYQLVGKRKFTVQWEGLEGAEASDIITYLFYENGFGQRKIKHTATGMARGRYAENNSYYAATVWPWVQGSDYKEDTLPETTTPDPIKYSDNIVKFEKKKK